MTARRNPISRYQSHSCHRPRRPATQYPQRALFGKQSQLKPRWLLGAPPSRGMTEMEWASRHSNLRIEIDPLRIFHLDQPNLPGAIPFLEPLFAPDGRFDIAVLFEIDQAMHVILFGETGHQRVAMFVDPTDKIAGDTNVKRATHAARQNVHPVGMLTAHCASRARSATFSNDS